ncbi:MAG TPA: phosphatidate cytidylyltransferase [Chitinophagaceae bacterium]|nr:phosphatidate cytidylyltransferase [Chitinophagaceae bacterium]
MALNLQTLRTRSLTALVFVLIMLGGLCWNEWSFFLLFSIIHFGCWAEYQRIIALINPTYGNITKAHKYGVMLAGYCLMMTGAGDALTIAGFHLHELGWWLVLILAFLLPLLELLFNPSIRPVNIGLSALGLLYISTSFALLLNLRGSESLWQSAGSKSFHMGFLMPLVIIFSIWINDTMAYITGSLIGRTPFSSISPKKTWEGTIGGILLSVSFIAWLAYKWQWSCTDAAIIAGIAAITGTAGDLLESKLKRMANIKDSGHIMPGHGGFLDRFDSLLLAIPFVWLYAKLVMAL